MKVLLISYWFPPSGVIGAKRWGEFYRLSQEDNSIEISVLTANWQGKEDDNPNIYYIGDEVKSIPFFSINSTIGYLDMLKHPSLMIRSLDRSLGSSWYKKSKQWMEQNSEKRYDLIISSFGPIASVLLGNYAKKVFKIPHIVDLRDLISIQGQKNKFPVINFLDKQIDKFIMKDVDKILVVSPTGEKKAKAFYKKEVMTIYNGLQYPIEDKKVDLSVQVNKTITILYMGTLGINRNPSKVLTLLNEYSKQYKEPKIVVKFASQDDPFNFIDKEILEYIEVVWLGYLDSQSLEIEKDKSTIFLVLEDLTPKGNENLTGKIFEYLYSKKPIMVSCHKGSDIINLLKDTNAGSLIENMSDFKSFLSSSRALNIEACNYYTRANQYRMLKDVMKKCNV
ncbi:hypothetical protein KKC13_08910 [bacterium]|nr:hypothetical protein [bacterium]MBU1957081.1 hypothetical protein [bacterium]